MGRGEKGAVLARLQKVNKEGVPRQRTSRGEGGEGNRRVRVIGWHRVTSLEEGAVSRVSAHRARGWASLTKNKMSPPPLESLLRDLLSRARHRRQRGHERPVRKVGKEDAAAVLRGEAGEHR